MKRQLRLLALLIALITLLAPAALAEEWKGEVIAKQITLRATAKSNGKTLGSIKNGAEVTILDEDFDGWYHVRHDGKEGYVMAQYVVKNPEHITTLSSTLVYAFPNSEKCVGQLSSYTRLTVIDIHEGYYVVNLRQASGFIPLNKKLMVESEVLSRPHLGRVQVDRITKPRNGPDTNLDPAGEDVQPGEIYDYVGMTGEWYLILIDNGTRPAFIWQGMCHVIEAN